MELRLLKVKFLNKIEMDESITLREYTANCQALAIRKPLSEVFISKRFVHRGW
jgi:hypothetical protein